MLIAARGAPVPRAKIAGLLWDRVNDEQARNSLRQDLGALVESLRKIGLKLIESDRTNLRIPEDAVSSAERFLFDETDDDEAQFDPATYRQSLFEDLYELSASFDEWIREERIRISNKLLGRFERRLAIIERDERMSDEAIAAARALLEFDPTHERAWRALRQSDSAADMIFPLLTTEVPIGRAIVFEERFLEALFERQRIVLLATQNRQWLDRAAVIISTDRSRGAPGLQTQFTRTQNELIRLYGSPRTFEDGVFGPDAFQAISDGRLIRLAEWRLPEGVLRLGIPQRTDGVVRIEIQYAKRFPPSSDTRWSLEGVR